MKKASNKNALPQPSLTSERSASPLLDALSLHIQQWYPAAGGRLENSENYLTEGYPNPDIEVYNYHDGY